jgi:hypothetical protein
VLLLRTPSLAHVGGAERDKEKSGQPVPFARNVFGGGEASACGCFFSAEHGGEGGRVTVLALLGAESGCVAALSLRSGEELSAESEPKHSHKAALFKAGHTGSAGLLLLPLDSLGLACAPPSAPHPPADGDDTPPAPASQLLAVTARGARTFSVATLLSRMAGDGWTGLGHHSVKLKPLRASADDLFSSPIVAATSFAAPGGAALCLLDRSSQLHVLSASSLRLVQRSGFPFPAVRGRFGSAELPTVFCSAPDGQLLSVWRDSRGECIRQGVRTELLEEYSAPAPPSEEASAVFWTKSRASISAAETAAPEVEAPLERSGSGAANFFSKLKDSVKRGLAAGKPRPPMSPADWDSVFPPNGPAKVESRSSAPPTMLRVGPPVGPPSTGAAESGRMRLLGPSRPPQAPPAPAVAYGGPRSVDDIRAKYGRAAGGMAENVERMNERGQKLENLQEKTARLEAEARAFSDSAKELARKSSLRGMLFG